MKTAAPERIDLPVSGMTCAACARAIERTLAVTPGVDRASVNLATNTATVEYDPSIAGVRDFVGAIEDLGYGVPEKEVPYDDAAQGYRRRLIVAAIFTLPVFVLGMTHGMIAIPYSPWIQLGAHAARDLLRGRTLLRRRVERAAARRRQHEFADLAGHRRGLPVFAGADGARPPRRLLRSRRRDHHADSHRPYCWKRGHADARERRFAA